MDGAVVVLYNPTKSELAHLKDYANVVSRTLILDNSQTSVLADITEFVDVDGSEVSYEHHPENPGLCKSMNYGIKRLAQQGCSWVLTMNSDSSFATDILSVFRGYVEGRCTDNVALLAPLYDYDRKRASSYDGYRSVPRAMMSGNYINVRVFIELGGFLEELFVDGIDFEYSLWARKHRFELIECGEAVLNHMPAETCSLRVFGKSVFKYGKASPSRYRYQARAQTYLLKTYKEPYDFLVLAYKMFKAICLFDNKPIYLKSISQGVREGLRMTGRLVD